MNIVITGAGGVLCSAFSRALAADGHKIALLDLNLEAAEREAEGIRKAGGKAIAVQANVLDKESLKKAHDIVLEKFGPCEVLINGAGGADLQPCSAPPRHSSVSRQAPPPLLRPVPGNGCHIFPRPAALQIRSSVPRALKGAKR